MKINDDDLLEAMKNGDMEYLVKQLEEMREALVAAAALQYTLERKIVNRNRTIIHNGQKRRGVFQ